MTHGRVSAAEIRALGFVVPESIPDCATVSVEGLQRDWSRATYEMEPCGKAKLEMRITEAFQWIELNITIDKNGNIPYGN